jgi:anti-sigma factor RsiW
MVVRLPRAPDVESQLISNHLRAMQLDSHLIDVVSSDHHTVKPWFAGKVDFAPVVKELPGSGYVLKGGRVDVVADRAAAVLVYEAGRHVIDVYMWPSSVGADDAFHSSRQDGFNLRHWEEGDLSVWCVSDMGANELETFAQRWRAAN